MSSAGNAPNAPGPAPSAQPAPTAPGNPYADFLRAGIRARAARLALARVDVNTFAELVVRDEETGKPFLQAPVHLEWHLQANAYPRTLIWAHVEAGKALPVTTPIPTPQGWRTMGDLQRGEEVFDRTGAICYVAGISAVQFDRKVYRLTFDDDSSLLADADHRWLAASIDDARAKLGPSRAHAGDGAPCACGCGLQAKVGKRFVHNHHRRPVRSAEGWRVVTTAEMLAHGVMRKSGAWALTGERALQHRWRIPLCGPVAFNAQVLPVHPYTLGVWLGDGTAGVAAVTCHIDDAEVVRRAAALCGGDLSGELPRDPRHPHIIRAMLRTTGKPGDRTGLTSDLRRLGVLHNKHIPAAYLLGSIAQREELLAGLLDTDGCVTGRNPRVEFCNTNKALAEGVLALARSLGFKARLGEDRAQLHGEDMGPRYRVTFVAGRPVFKLARKLARQRLGKLSGRASYRCVTAIDAVESVPVKCITVDSPDHSYVAGRDYTVTHNTSQLSVVRPLHELGKDPTLRVVIVSNTGGQASKIARPLMQMIETPGGPLHEVFPDLVPSPRESDPWHAGALTVMRPTIAKDPSIQVTGIHGNILGARIDLLILDDILDYENTRTANLRDDLWNWIQSTLMGRLTARARVLCVGTAFHPDDALHRLAKHPGWMARRYPAIDEQGRPRWAVRWPKERIDAKRLELTPIEFARQMLCVSRDDSTSRFKWEWLEGALKRGAGRQLAYAINFIPAGCGVYTGVDLAVSKASHADETVLFTIMVHPNGDRELLCIDAGKWTGPEIIQRINDCHRRYQSIITVESNQAQAYLNQFIRAGSSVPVRDFNTGSNKMDPAFGVESLAVELANGKWIVPNPGDGTAHPEIHKWFQEMLFYSPTAHTGDRLMACVAPGYMVTTERGLVPVDQVKVGDKVLTHRARWREVTGTTNREYSGSAVRLKPRGLAELVVTSEHPVWSAHAWFNRDGSNRLLPRDWAFRDAGVLKVGRKQAGDFVLAPAAAWPGVAPIDDPGLAFLVGLYLAEGWVSHHQASFAFNAKEQYLAEFVRGEARRLWGANTSIYVRGPHSITVTIQSVAAKRFFAQFGKRAAKGLPWHWMALPTHLGLLVVRGWLVGDGSISTSASGTAHLRGVSVAPSIIYQAQQFLWRAGLLPSVAPFAQTGEFQGKPCGQLPAWCLSLSGADTAKLLANPNREELARWGSPWVGRARTNSASVAVLEGAAVKLASLERFTYDGMVFNLHVAEDESFVVGGIAVHNCWFAREGARAGGMKAETGSLNMQSR